MYVKYTSQRPVWHLIKNTKSKAQFFDCCYSTRLSEN